MAESEKKLPEAILSQLQIMVVSIFHFQFCHLAKRETFLDTIFHIYGIKCCMALNVVRSSLFDY